MVRQRRSALSAPLVGARFYRQERLSVPPTGALLDALKSRPTLRQLCGWDRAGEIPSEPTFSRACAAFADDQLPQRIHEHLVKTHAGQSWSATSAAPPRPSRPPNGPHPNPRPRHRQHPANAGGPSKAKFVRPRRPNTWNSNRRARWPRTWPTCPPAVTWVASATAKGTRKAGLAQAALGHRRRGFSGQRGVDQRQCA